MKPWLWKFIMLLLFTVYTSTGYAQLNNLGKGDHVRILAPAVSLIYITGDINEISDRGILLQGSSDEILFEEIDRLELGKVKTRTGRGMLYGAMAGAFLGGTIAVMSNDTEESTDEDSWLSGAFQLSDSEVFLIGAVVGTLPGTLIGAAVGSSIDTVKWKNIHIEPAGQQLALRYFKQSRSSGVTLRWSF